jgi:hypothetical protein
MDQVKMDLHGMPHRMTAMSWQLGVRFAAVERGLDAARAGAGTGKMDEELVRLYEWMDRVAETLDGVRRDVSRWESDARAQLDGR